MMGEDFLQQIDNVLGTISLPDRLCKDEPTTYNQLMIEKDFGGKLRDNLSDKLCVTLLLDSALISDMAFLYYLPKLINFVLKNGGYEYFLYSRLEALDFSALNKSVTAVIKETIICLKGAEIKFNEDLERDTMVGIEKWEQRMTLRGTIDDMFLIAVCRGDLDQMKFLLTEGATPNAKDFNDKTAIEIAEIMGHSTISAFLKSLENL